MLEAAAKDPAIKQALVETAVAADKEIIAPFLQWRYNGRAAGNGWNSPVNNAQWGTDYLNRTAIAKSNMYENRPEETKYIYTDNDSQGKQLDGQNTYAITFPKGQMPPVKGFWSLTLYNAEHFFHPNPLKRYSLGTKNKNLDLNADGSLTLYAGAKSPGKDKENNWLPAPDGNFSLYIRAYWPENAIARRHVDAAEGREGEVSGEVAHDPPCQSSTRRRAVAQRGRAVRARPDSGARPDPAVLLRDAV